jgi:hypothetical protein
VRSPVSCAVFTSMALLLLAEMNRLRTAVTQFMIPA